ncbi:hypothetical protein PFICI_12310 [Pestalotiopsis fici W106-1]|uniref:Uncharacterized protein n=1 Tax=Pestalotiopsis fici (strain W106-1 / CGMCC3.15140) TaxID=1229662 RepID=W3WRC0_PESFW|nr:uncharacterized protein PFICI_12310 [Pestalotiopsis fici W106-1]ETS75366.1 hypothetical protein PFICI_12310 [Pestalotiopsis fici W106-1]
MRDIYKYCRHCLVWLGGIKEHVSVEDAERGWEVLTYVSAAGKAGNYRDSIAVAMSSGQEAFHHAVKALWTSAGQRHPWWDRI